MNNKGFTLIELIVVLFIAGMMIAGLLLNTSLVNPNKKTMNMTRNLAKLMHYAHQQAELSNEQYALSLTKEGYLFLIFQGDGWGVVKKKPLLPNALPKQLKKELIIDKKLVEALKKDQYVPHILLLASGEMSPFEWTFRDLENDLEIVMTGSFNGAINIENNTL